MKTKNGTRVSGYRSYAMAAICCLGISALGTSAFAQGYDDTYSYDYTTVKLDRPIQRMLVTSTAQTEDQGQALVSVGANYLHSGDMRLTQIRGRAEYGITDHLQAQAEFPMSIVDHPGGYIAQAAGDNIQVGAMYSMVPGGSAPIALSAGMDVQFPTGSPNSPNYQNTVVYKPGLMAAHDLGPTQIQANAQAEFPASGGGSNALNYNVGAILPLGVVAPTVELNGRSTQTSRNELYVTPGAFYRFSDKIEAGVGVPIGISDQAQSTRVLAKLNVKF